MLYKNGTWVNKINTFTGGRKSTESWILIKKKEMKKACYDLKNRKTSEPGNIPSEPLKYGAQNYINIQ